MRIFAAFLLCVVTAATLPAQSSSVAASRREPPMQGVINLPPAQPIKSTPNIDPAKEAAIRNLLELAGTSNTFQQLLAGMSNNARPMLNSLLPPGKYRERLSQLFLQRLQSKLQFEEFVSLLIPIYDKHFSQEEIEGLIDFYQTPVGKKALSVLPQIVVESQTQGMKLGQQYGGEAMREVLQEHPDLQRALAQASSALKK